jgi:hypothetical protein
MMYKHHPYKNIVERKLEQLPAPDTDALWNSMEGILDKHLPQKKRRRGVFGWLFTHKAWMLAGISVLSLAGLALVYTSNSNKTTALTKTETTQPDNISTAIAKASTTPAATEATANETTAVTANTESIAAITATNNNTENTIEVTTAAATATAAGEREESIVNTTASSRTTRQADATIRITNKRTSKPVSTPVTLSATAAENRVALDNNSENIEENHTIATTHWAATASEVAATEKAAPAVDPSSVVMNTTTLESLSQQIASATASAAKKMGKLKEEKGPYAGVVAGVDMSSVGMKSMKAGNNTGIIIGYALNNRWSVESGLQWNKKRLYADGTHYKPDNLTTQPGLTILDVNSSNQIIELPVNVKYNILTGNHKLFATAGLSSYFIRKEGYNVGYEWNGAQYNEYNTYTNASRHWLSVANLGVGYSHQLGSFGTLRLEPYLKLPLRDMGIGNMRLMSTGLNIGFTKMLKR